MSDKIDKITTDENIAATSALVEVAAMGRVGTLSAGTGLLRQRQTQIKRDARKQARRGKTVRAAELQLQAAKLEQVQVAMSKQREKEQIRPLLPIEDGALLQGRATRKGFGEAGLTVSLVAPDGTVLDRTKSGANGSFVLTQKTDVAGATIVINDLDGTELGVSTPPALTKTGSVFVTVPLEKLKPGRVSPVRPDGRRPVMPDLVGLNFADAEKQHGAELAGADVVLERYVAQSGRVLSQDPAAGTEIAPGTQIKLQVAVGKKTTDLAVARSLVRLDPEIREVGLSSDEIAAAEEALGVKSLVSMAKVSEMDSDRIAQAMPQKKQAQAKAMQGAITRALSRFPNG